MISLHILGRGDGVYVLRERDYPAQGISPSYANICRLTPEEAATLHRTGLVTLWNDAKRPAEPGDPKDMLSLEDTVWGGLEIRLRLPACEVRNKELDMALPGYEAILATAVVDHIKCDNLIRNTGIADGRVRQPVLA